MVPFGAYRDAAGGRVRIIYDVDDRAIAQIDELGHVTRTSYDQLGRVVSRTYPELNAVEFEYDARSNVRLLRRLAKPGSAEVASPIVVSATYDPFWNKPISIVDGRGAQADLTYVPFGSNGAGLIATHTAPADSSGQRPVWNFAYDAYGRAAQISEPLLWYEGSSTAGRSWLHADRQGSVVAATDVSAGASSYAYGPFGEPHDWQGSRFRYTGQIALPEIQLYHYKARVYDPMLGRFLQTHPVGYEDDLNL